MSGDTGDTTQLVDEVSRDLVGEIAPEELDLFDELAQEYHADPNPPEVTRGGDSALGFGMEAALIATSPAVMAAVTVGVGFVMQVATDALKDQTKGFIQDQVKKLFAGKKPDDVNVQLNADQLAHLRDLAAKEASRFGLKKAEADRLADAIAGRVAMSR
jgi:hypothetical protein